jgi:predicted TIM-barrel fold metal-dependent hydrolase
LQIDVSTFDAFDVLVQLPVPIVIDHFGYMQARKGTAEPGFQRLLDLVARGRCHVKLSAPYRLTAWKREGYGAVGALARALAATDPQRLLWGSDWPHTQFEATQSYAKNRKFLDELVTDAAERARVLASPRELFRF